MTADCRDVRPVLFASIEDGVSRAERRRVATHLAACEDCRREMEEERALSALLGAPSGLRPASRLAAFPWLRAAAASAILLLTFFAIAPLLRPSAVYGDIQSRSLDVRMTIGDAGERALEATNHIVVEATGWSKIEIPDTGTLRVRGPAVIDLDRDEATGRWKLILLRGALEAEIRDGASLSVASLHGERTLASGRHPLALDPANFQDGAEGTPPGKGRDAAHLLQSALDAFFARKDMAGAEAGLRAALAAPDLTPVLRSEALFYLSAALGNQSKNAEAVRVNEEWLELNPNDKARAFVLYWQGVYTGRLGESEQSRAYLRQVVETATDPTLVQLATTELASVDDAGSNRYEPGRILPADAGRPGPYVVVTVGLDEKGSAEHRAFRDVAREAARFHQAEVLDFDGRDFEGLERELRRRSPENVLIVIPPEALDVVLHRRILLLSARIDEDLFPDFAFGYLTARSGAGLRNLWSRTVAVHRGGLKSKTWIGTAVTSGMKSVEYADNVPPIAAAAGFKGSQLYFSCVESDPDVAKFVREKLPRLEQAGVIEMTGNGDPQGVWLFDDRRNIDRSKHWPYDPAKVGQDPKGEIPRITADRFAALRLMSPVVWSGTCHSAATRRVFVEGDIVSTFGTTGDRATVHELTPETSLCLSIIEAGAVAFLAPIAANHGLAVDREIQFCLREGATLGETVKSTYDDVFLACGGKLVLDLPVAGRPRAEREAIMQGGGANRILIGDPALAPFRATPDPLESVEARASGGKGAGLEIAVEWKDGFHSWAWDMYGVDRNHDWRIGARVRLDDGLVPAGKRLALAASVRAGDAAGAALPYAMKRAEPEVFHGRRYLHLQASADRKLVQDRAQQATFSVAITPAPAPVTGER